MISVVIPTLNSDRSLAGTLSALVPAAVEGFVREVIVADGGSSDATATIADGAGVSFISGERSRGAQLSAGARAARFPWLLFLHADTVLDDGWMREASGFMHAVDTGSRSPAAAVFRFKLDDGGMAPRSLEMLVQARCRLLRLPYGDQGLLISRALYNEIGGFRPLQLMEDVDIIRRLGRRRVVLLKTAALTSAQRYRREGYLRRMLRNGVCISLYGLGVSPERIATLYEKRVSDPGKAP